MRRSLAKCVYTCVQSYVPTRSTHTQLHTYTPHVCIPYAYIHTHIHAQAYTDIHAYVHTCMRVVHGQTYMHVYIDAIDTYTQLGRFDATVEEKLITVTTHMVMQNAHVCVASCHVQIVACRAARVCAPSLNVRVACRLPNGAAIVCSPQFCLTRPRTATARRSSRYIHVRVFVCADDLNAERRMCADDLSTREQSLCGRPTHL
jgi:hypothetical protein